MSRKQWYVELFENYAKTYDRESFTQGTIGEVDFIEKEIGSDRKKRILDIGCGTGRHAVELAKRGYDVTGVDLSADQLARAREKAEAAGVKASFLCKDARELSISGEFDVALIICEGAFPLMETDEMNFKILQNAAEALKSRGKMIMTTLNALFPICHSVQEFMKENPGESQTANHHFDWVTFRDRNTLTFTDDSGNQKTLNCSDRYYAPPEIAWLLKSAGFVKVEIFGCRLGAWSRTDVLTREDFEMLVIAEK